MAFYVFLVINAVLFIRPSDLFDGIETWPVYEACMIVGIVLAWPGMLHRLSVQSLVANPICSCVLVFLGCVVTTTTVVLSGTLGNHTLVDFGSVIIFYLMLFSVINTPSRLGVYLGFLVCCIAVTSVLPLAQEAGLIRLKSLDLMEQSAISTDGESETIVLIYRLKGTGIFNDPNDFAMLMVVGIALSTGMRDIYMRSWLGTLATAACLPMIVAFSQTASRGGVIALATSLLCWLSMKYGWRRAAVLSCALVPGLLFVIGGRAADIGGAVEQGTGQSRIQLWSSSLQALRSHLPLGVGYRCASEYNDAHQVSHNSFLDAFVEAGLVGGTAFQGAFLLALIGLARSPVVALTTGDEIVKRARPSLFAAVGGAAGAMFTLSREYVVPTYVLLGLATAWCNLAGTSVVWPGFRVSPRLCLRLGYAAVALLAVIYLLVRILARFS